jgi:hypothetical protein
MDSAVAARFFTTVSAPTAYGKDYFGATPEERVGRIQSGLLAGAGASKFATAETAQWAGRVTPTLQKSLGARPEEILGVGAALSVPAGTPDVLQTYMFALEKEVGKFRIEQLEKKEIAPGEAKSGLIAGFKALQADSEAYADALKEMRFKRAALALEGAVDQAAANTEEIGEAFASTALFQAKLAESPLEINRLQAAQIAKAQKEAAWEKTAQRQIELETAISQNKALAGFTGKPLTVEKGWEKALEAGATYGAVDQSTKAATGRLLDRMEKEYPDIFREYILGKTHQIRRERVDTGSLQGPRSRGVLAPIPGITAEQRQAAVEAAMAEITERNILPGPSGAIDERANLRAVTRYRGRVYAAGEDPADPLHQRNVGTFQQMRQAPASDPEAVVGAIEEQTGVLKGIASEQKKARARPRLSPDWTEAGLLIGSEGSK